MQHVRISEVKFNNIKFYNFGNKIEISGIIMSDGEEGFIIPFEDIKLNYLSSYYVNDMTKEKWNKLIFQLDNVETVIHVKDENDKLIKIIVRKSQRKLEEKIVWGVFRRDNYTCQYCGKNNIPLTVDHIVRWENLGQTIKDNLITACKKCNNTRGNMEMCDWLISDYYTKKVPTEFISKNFDAFNKAINLPLRKYKRKR